MLYGRWVVYVTIKDRDTEDLSDEAYEDLVEEEINKIHEYLEQVPGLIEIDFEGTEVG